MKFERKLSIEGTPVADQIKWKIVPVEIKNPDGSIVFSMKEVEAPAHWSDTAVKILAQKYFRKAGVPTNSTTPVPEDIPVFLQRSVPGPLATYGSETSAKQVLHRLAGAWTYHGWKMGLFNYDGPMTTDTGKAAQAQIFYDELFLILANQLAAPNSPQWFNTGLWWAYGIEGPVSGQWAINYDLKKGIVGQPFETNNAYQWPQPHACFIQPVADDLVNPGGIMDLWQKEVRLFKLGSGTGSNFSNIRGKGELLSGGGISSGLMSFLEIGDRAAGAIKSGGTTRRAAKMVIVDADHPEIEDFIWWKAREEQKAAAMWIGSKMLVKADLDLECRDKLITEGLLPQALSDQMEIGQIEMEEFSIDYEGEAIRTVGGQNANNSVRITDEFIQAVEEDAEWNLIDRTNRDVRKTISAKDLWNQICRAAWASADPGLQFHDTINKYHTCKADGEIKASNPCSEYMFLDNTACNLASLNLCAFFKPPKLEALKNEFDIPLFKHVARLMTCVLDISVTMASFPSREIALGSYNYRTLGLGYANLGALLMQMGLPYDSDRGREIASAITSLLTAQAYRTSLDLAVCLGPFPRWEANSESMTNVIQMHRNTSYVVGYTEQSILKSANILWDEVEEKMWGTGFRNAQVTLLAPTGTIGLLMDCDTLGVEPDFSLQKAKSLAGGGGLTLTNNSISQALTQLDYKPHARNLILAYVAKNGTTEGCPDLKPEHQTVFDCAVAPEGFSRCIEPMGHVKMVAAIQPFLSGAVSKTINMPNSATVEDVSRVYKESWKLGLKAVALYRDGSKLSQPLSAAKPTKPEFVETVITGADLKDFAQGNTAPVFAKDGVLLYESELKDESRGRFVPKEELKRGIREYLPWRRTSVYTQKVNIGDQSLHITVGRYPDGRPGEIRLELSRVGTTLDAMTNMVAMMISIGLQYGVPVEEFVERLRDRKFEPSGFVEGHDRIKWAASIADYIARELGLEFLGKTEMGQVQGDFDKNMKAEILKQIMTETETKYKEEHKYPKPVRAVRDICPSCHEPCLIRSGTCQTCTACGFNDGCGG